MGKIEAIVEGLHKSRNPRDWAMGASMAAGAESQFSDDFMARISDALGGVASKITGLQKEKRVKAFNLGKKIALQDPDAARKYLYQ